MMPRDRIATLRGNFESEYCFRLHMLLLISATVGAGALISKGLLALGAESMMWRYPLAALLSYGVFLGLVRAWLWYLLGTRTRDRRHRGWEPDLPDLDFPDWETPDLDLGWFDLDEIFAPILMLLAVIGLSFAGVYVIWTAPSILAEIAVEATFFAGLGWMWRAVERTWLPMTAMLLMLCTFGWALEKRCPDAVKLRQAIACPVARW